jgi:diguanylate cyclase (GGDEF)-like protein
MLEKLLDISRKLSENRILDPLLEYAINVALELFGAEYGYLVLLNPDGSLNFRVRTDKDGKTLAEPEEQISHTIFEKVIQQRQPLVIADAILDPEFQTAHSVRSLQLRSVMCVPLIARGTLLGAIYIENRSEKNLFREQDLLPLEYFAAQAAISIENAILNEDLESRVSQRTAELNHTITLLEKEIAERKYAQALLQHLAITDHLTKLYNRRHFFELAEQAFRQAQRYNHSLSALMIDADHFKQVNDQYGHLIGDQVLQNLAGVLKRSLRDADILGRYGGEEFAILLPETDLDAAARSAERLRLSVADSPAVTEKGSIPITISLGVACLRGADEQIDQLINRADQALYLAKGAGRNQVRLWTAGEAGSTG